MIKRLSIIIGSITLALGILGLGLTAYWRIERAREFRQPHLVTGAEGAAYVARLIETAVGKADTGYLVIVYLQLQNQSPRELQLRRDSFVLIDHNKKRFAPATDGTQTALIKLPAGSVLDREMLSYTVRDDSLAGSLDLQLGPDNLVRVKGSKPYAQPLQAGEFRSFRRRDWS